MADGNPVIVAKVGGKQRRLATPRQWRAAIANGEIARDTEIVFEQSRSRLAAMPAGDCPELIALFDEILGPVAIASPPPPVALEPPPVHVPPEDRVSTVPVAPVRQVALDVEIESATSPEREHTNTSEAGDALPSSNLEAIEENPIDDQGGSGKPGGKEGLLVGGFLAFALVSVLIAVNIGNSSGTEHESPPVDDAAIEGAAEEAAVTGSDRYYTYLATPVRMQPSDDSPELRSLARGQEISGMAASVPGWIQVDGGGYVRADMVQGSPPPSLDASTADDYFTVEKTAIHAGPGYDTAEIGSLDSQEKIAVLGTVNGDFAEVDRDGSAVGYVPWASFGGVGGSGRRAGLKFRNNCSVTKNVALSLVIDGQRVNGSGYWTLYPGWDDYITYDDKPGPVYVDSTDNYWLDLGDEFHGKATDEVRGNGKDQVFVNGDLKEMQRIVVQAESDGSYVALLCG